MAVAMTLQETTYFLDNIRLCYSLLFHFNAFLLNAGIWQHAEALSVYAILILPVIAYITIMIIYRCNHV